jgi:riboflavin kinase/FMN adenylyltransferase
MKLIGDKEYKDFYGDTEKKLVVGLGLFDGVHRGHQEIIKRVVEEAKRINGTPILFTFSNPPETVVAPARTPTLLITPETKVIFAIKIGIDTVIMPEFTPDIAKLSPEEFVKQILMEKLHVHTVVARFNYNFGVKRTGNMKLMSELGEKYGFNAITVDPVMVDDVRVSSTRIRNALAVGSLEAASEMLGRPFHLEGKVIKGAGKATSLAVPTANLKLKNRAIIPYGVYIVRVQKFTLGFPPWIGPVNMGIMNYGLRPTITDLPKKPDPVAEVHLFDFNGSLYGEDLGVVVLEFIREEKHFPDEPALQAQIKEDVEYTLESISKWVVPDNLFGF